MKSITSFNVIFTIMKHEQLELYQQLTKANDNKTDLGSDFNESNKIADFIDKVNDWSHTNEAESNISVLHSDIIRIIENLVDRKYSHQDISISSENMKNGLIYDIMIELKPKANEK